ncbi:DUF4232 domain-containing protein [Streptomyces sp. NPDC054796]
MTQHQDIPAAGPVTGTAGGPVTARPGVRVRLTVAAAVVLAATAVLSGCGDKVAGASGPHKVSGTAAPAGGDASDGASKSPDGKASKSGKPSSGPSSAKGEKGSGGGSAGGGGQTSPSESEGQGGAVGGAVSGGGGEAGGACLASDLDASVGPNHPGGGQQNYALILTNNSGRTCTVHGYPGVAFVDGAGKQVSVDPTRAPGQPSTVELSAGNSAWAPLSFANVQMTGVETVTPATVVITPPDQQASLPTPWNGDPVTNSNEGSVPKVGPLTAGTGS